MSVITALKSQEDVKSQEAATNVQFGFKSESVIKKKRRDLKTQNPLWPQAELLVPLRYSQQQQGPNKVEQRF